jgi:methylated-DNA-[protein]-cysteine S-methyltransferase
MRGYVLSGTPLGPLTIFFNDEGISRLEFGNTLNPSSDETATGEEPILYEAVKALKIYFSGECITFDWHALRLCPSGTDFQKQVWQEISLIPYGHTSTYGAISTKIGKPSASRAVGGATGRNPIPLLIPCHRVLGSSGQLTGYSAPGGLDTKSRLLALEGIHTKKCE